MRHYDHHHTTVSEVRACDAQRHTGTTKTAAKPLAEGLRRLERAHATSTRVAKATAAAQPTPGFATHPAHPNRVQYARDLINNRETNLISFAADEVMMNVLAGNVVSADEIALLIDDLRAAPRRSRTAKPVHEEPATVQATVPQQTTVARKALWAEWRALAVALTSTSSHPSGARFAIENLTGANDLSFWWISEHNGFCKLRQVIGGGGREDVRDPQRMIDIAKRINEAGPYEAMIRYGQEIGSCGHCGRELTNQESRAAGIGPICRNK